MDIKSSTPFVSVIIPAFNEENGITPTLKSLFAQNYPQFELIVIDNNSTDKTSEVARALGAKVFIEKNKGVAHARQRGFTEAKGEIVLSTDADALHPENWIEKIVAAFQEDSEIVAVGGLGEFYSGPLSAKIASKYLFYPFLLFDKSFSGGWNLSGFNMAVKKSAFEKCGGFSTELKIAEDIDLSKKLRKIGKIVIKKDIVVRLSGRRYKDGLLRGLWDYAPSVFFRMIGKSGPNTFRDVRD